MHSSSEKGTILKVYLNNVYVGLMIRYNDYIYAYFFIILPILQNQVVKKLRTPKYATWLKRKNLKYAIIDNETRWNSVFNMLFRLLELKEFCQTHHSTNTELKLKKSEWDSIQSIVSFYF